MAGYLWTGQTRCFDARGGNVPCPGSGQDAEFRPGLPWPEPRFRVEGGVVQDALTGLAWTISANPAGFPRTWVEALQAVREMNEAGERGFSDWRLPTRRELTSLIDYSASKPALPPDHPFQDVVQAWMWTSTTSAVNPAYAWYVHLEGGRMFYGRKSEYHLLWPVRGVSGVLPVTGQRECFDADGQVVPRQGSGPLPGPLSGQDPEVAHGVAWPEPRFEPAGDAAGLGVRDRLTGLVWLGDAGLVDLAGAGPLDWTGALEAVRDFSRRTGTAWRLPTIRELESLVDCSRSGPALSEGHPFKGLAEAYWSSTTSGFEPDWAFVLYLAKGAVGVGFKPGREFAVWPVLAGG